MGTWGSGNLESDGSQDTLANICDELFTRVIELLQHPRGHEYDDEEIDELFVRIEMIFALYERKMITSAPNPDELNSLFVPYLERWAAYYKSAGHDPPADRREVIEETFQTLLAIARAGAGGSFLHRLDLISDKMGRSDESHES